MIVKVVSSQKGPVRNHGTFISFCRNTQIRFSRNLKDTLNLDEGMGAIFIEQINENVQPPEKHYYVAFVPDAEQDRAALRLRYDSARNSLITLSTEVCDMFITTDDANAVFKRQIVYDGDIADIKKPRRRNVSHRVAVKLDPIEFPGMPGYTFYELLPYDPKPETKRQSSKNYRKGRRSFKKK